MSNFNLQDVLDLEQAILASLPPEIALGAGYFKEVVAQDLYRAWLADPTDMRLLEYAFPLINSVMVKYMPLLKNSPLEQGEIFNTLCLQIYDSFRRYSPARGRLFTFLTITTTFRIKDLVRGSKIQVVQLEDWDASIDDSAFYVLEDFKQFLRKFKHTQGRTAKRMLDAWLEVLDHEEIVATRLQGHIIARVGQLTALPKAVVEPFYRTVLDRFTHSVLD